MSTRNSRQVNKGNKLYLSEQVQKLYDSEDEGDEALTQEQIKINKKLSESGLLEEGLNWDEKKTLLKTLSASVNTANYEKHVRSSPKQVEGKERIIPIELEDDVLEKGEVAFTRRIISDSKKSTGKSGNLITRPLEAIKNYFSSSGSPKKVENQEVSQENLKCNNSVNVIRESECNKINVDNKKIEKISIDIISSDEDSETIFVSKKRPSPPETGRIDCAKKLKMDQNSTKVKASNSRKPLRTEIERATKQNDLHFNRRSIQTILNELQRMNRSRKEASAKYKFPVRWGNPIVRNSNERWDGQTIPQKLIDRYQKYLSKNGSEGPDQRSGPSEGTFRNFEIEKAAGNSSEDREKSLVEDSDPFEELKKETTRKISEIAPRQYERKSKTRNQTKHSAGDEFENVDDDDDEEWFPKEVPKKHEKTNKSFKANNPIEPRQRKPVAKLEKGDNYKFFKSKNPEQTAAENAGNGKSDWSKREPQQSPNFTEQNSQQVDGAGDEERVPCPICNKSFKKDQIENHATECASKTFQD